MDDITNRLAALEQANAKIKSKLRILGFSQMGFALVALLAVLANLLLLVKLSRLAQPGNVDVTQAKPATKSTEIGYMRAKGFTLLNDKGDELGAWGLSPGAEGGVELLMHNADGINRVAIKLPRDNTARIDLKGNDGLDRASLAVDRFNRAKLKLYDREGDKSREIEYTGQ
jgi:hypothetical protein